MSNIQNNHNIPILNSLVAAGDSRKKTNLKKPDAKSTHLDELNQRIDEIEDAIGQGNSDPVGRAFAIRAETNKITKHRAAFKADTDLKKSKQRLKL